MKAEENEKPVVVGPIDEVQQVVVEAIAEKVESENRVGYLTDEKTSPPDAFALKQGMLQEYLKNNQDLVRQLSKAYTQYNPFGRSKKELTSEEKHKIDKKKKAQRKISNASRKINQAKNRKNKFTR